MPSSTPIKEMESHRSEKKSSTSHVHPCCLSCLARELEPYIHSKPMGLPSKRLTLQVFATLLGTVTLPCGCTPRAHDLHHPAPTSTLEASMLSSSPARPAYGRSLAQHAARHAGLRRQCHAGEVGFSARLSILFTFPVTHGRARVDFDRMLSLGPESTEAKPKVRVHWPTRETASYRMLIPRSLAWIEDHACAYGARAPACQ